MQDTKKLTSKEKANYIKRLMKQGLSLEDSLKLLEETEEVSQAKTEVQGTITISKTLKEIGVPAHLKGYECLRACIAYVIEHGRCPITNELYPVVAKKLNTTPSKLERAIRHAVEVSFDRADIDELYKYFGYSINQMKGKPTNSEFIITVAEYIKQNC